MKTLRKLFGMYTQIFCELIVLFIILFSIASGFYLNIVLLSIAGFCLGVCYIIYLMASYNYQKDKKK